MRINRLKKCTLIAIIISIPLIAASQERISIPRIKGELKFDGLIDDPCWQNVLPLQMVMHTPVFGNQPSEKTEVRIATPVPKVIEAPIPCRTLEEISISGENEIPQRKEERV